MKLSILYENVGIKGAIADLQNIDISKYFSDNVKWDHDKNPKNTQPFVNNYLSDYIEQHPGHIQFDGDNYIIEFDDNKTVRLSPQQFDLIQKINVFRSDRSGYMIRTRENHKPNV